MNLVGIVNATSPQLPPIQAAGYEFVMARNGVFVRAEDDRLDVCVPGSLSRFPELMANDLRALVDILPHARLKVRRIPSTWLYSVLQSARRHLPNEVMYQFSYAADRWHCYKPTQQAERTAVDFADSGEAVVDLHSHGSMPAFFSETDNADEQGLRFYAVIGEVDSAEPKLALRVGVYGYHWNVPVSTVFTDAGPFTEVDPEVELVVAERKCRVCGCTNQHGCANKCWWVEPDLCSNCSEVAWVAR